MLQIEVQHINKDTLLRSLTRDHISTLAELLAGDRSQEAGDKRQSYRYKYRLATRPTGRWRGWLLASLLHGITIKQFQP